MATDLWMASRQHTHTHTVHHTHIQFTELEPTKTPGHFLCQLNFDGSKNVNFRLYSMQAVK